MQPFLDQLPSELYSAILTQIPLQDLQETTYSLIRASPRSPIPRHHLFTFVRLRTQRQILLLCKLLKEDHTIASRVKTLSLECWTVDPDIAINLIDLLRHVHELWICIGRNFAPKRLEELLLRPFDNLRSLSLWFRPHIERASYSLFLKGAYFDSTLVALSRWPSGCLPHLSIVQEPVEASRASTHSLAQPFTFFQLETLSTLVTSPFASGIMAFRFRIPFKEVVRYLCAGRPSIPKIGLLDLSTCIVAEADIEVILGRFLSLQYLILDDSVVFNQRGDSRGGADGRWWFALGKRMALVGVKCAKDKEAMVKAWVGDQNKRAVEDEITATAAGNQVTMDPALQIRPKKGRKGLSTASISLRDSKLASRPTGSQTTGVGDSALSAVSRIRVLPPAPSLKAFAITVPALVSADPALSQTVREGFTRGWTQGLAQLSSIRARIRTSWRKGSRVMTFTDDWASKDRSRTESGLDGLAYVEDDTGFAINDDEFPVLCLSGSSNRSATGHVGDCAHSKGWEVWGEES